MQQIVFLLDSVITDLCFKNYLGIVAPDLRTNPAIFHFCFLYSCFVSSLLPLPLSMFPLFLRPKTRTCCAATERNERTDCFRMLSERSWFPKLPATSIFNKNTYLTNKKVQLKKTHFYGFIPGRVFRKRQILRELIHLPWPASSNMNKKLSLNGKLT